MIRRSVLLPFLGALAAGCSSTHSDPGSSPRDGKGVIHRIGPVRMAIHPHWIEDETSHTPAPFLCLVFASLDGKEHEIIVWGVTLGWEIDETRAPQWNVRTVSATAATRFVVEYSSRRKDVERLQDYCKRIRVKGSVDGEAFERVYELP